MASPSFTRILVALVLLAALALTACAAPVSPAPPLTPTLTFTPSPSPTLTPLPFALSVNGEGITVPEFEAELARYQAAQDELGNTVSAGSARHAVGDEFIDTLLLAQAAIAKGYQLDEAAVQSRMDALAEQLGGSAALTDWQAAHGYTDAAFRADLRRQMAAASMRDQIIASVPSTAEQVHVKQILLYNEKAAQQALGYLKAGWDFNDLAARYDPLTKGELGWFPRGYLSEPLIEQAAFALQPGQYSDILQPQAGFEILFVADRQLDRPLSPDALRTLQASAVQDWLAQQRNESKILFTP